LKIKPDGKLLDALSGVGGLRPLPLTRATPLRYRYAARVGRSLD